MEESKIQRIKKELARTEGEEYVLLALDLAKITNCKPPLEVKGFLDKAFRLASDLNLEESLVEIHIYYVAIFYRLGDRVKCKENAFASLAIAEGLDNPFLLASALKKCQDVYNVFEKYSNDAKECKYGLRALEIAKEHNLEDALGAIYTTVGTSYLYGNRMEDATQFIIKGIEILRLQKKYIDCIVAYYNLGTRIGDQEKGLEYLWEAAKIANEHDLYFYACGAYREISGHYYGLKQYQKQLKWLRHAIVIAEREKLESQLAELYERLCAAIVIIIRNGIPPFDKEKLISEAIDCCNKMEALEMTKDQFVDRKKMVRAEIAYVQEKYDLAIRLFLEVHESVDDGYKYVIDQWLYWTYKAVGNYKKALEFYERHEEAQKEKYKEAKKKNIQELHAQFETKEKEAEIKRVTELEEMKTRFFSQITHELRTPVALIKGPLQEIRKESDPAKIEHFANIIERNSDRLLLLINQLLDLNKVESKMMEIQLSTGSLSDFIERLVNSFNVQAEYKKIELKLSQNSPKDLLQFDADKFEKIVFNLLSNAFKFTPPHGSISVVTEFYSLEEELTEFSLTVTDSGIGIANEEIDRIFDRFYQAGTDAHFTTQGTGIGLSLVKELIELMKGKLEVESELGVGSSFCVSFPLRKALKAESDLTPQIPVLFSHELPSSTEEGIAKKEKTPLLLLVEDNRDMQLYVSHLLKDRFQVLQAYNGAEGVEMAKEYIPDLIITDVMMPKKDGYQLCEELKNEVLTSHIPIVMLTAKNSNKSRIAGLTKGADIYLGKPFQAKELDLSLSNLLVLRSEMQKKFNEQLVNFESKEELELATGKFEELALESQFLKRVMDKIEENLDAENFTSNALAKKMFLSNSQLYRKIQALTNSSVTKFIREYRLYRAKSMLLNGGYTVQDAAFNVGYSLSYFSRSFKNQFGVSASTLLDSPKA